MTIIGSYPRIFSDIPILPLDADSLVQEGVEGFRDNAESSRPKEQLIILTLLLPAYATIELVKSCAASAP